MAFGPMAGGVLVDLSGWRAVFLVNVPLAVLVLALVAGAAVRCPPGTRRIDRWTQLAVCATLALLTDALIALGAGAWTHAGCAAAGTAAAGLAFAARERRGPAPVLPPALLGTRGMPTLLLAGAAVNFALLGVLFVLPCSCSRRWGCPRPWPGWRSCR
ncbi:hypothetical protein ACFQ0M_03525 [Kitasatospora aburaviensis]